MFMFSTRRSLEVAKRKNDYNKIYNFFKKTKTYHMIKQYYELLTSTDLQMNETDVSTKDVDSEWHSKRTLIHNQIKYLFIKLVKYETLTRSFNKTFTKRLMPKFIQDRIFSQTDGGGKYVKKISKRKKSKRKRHTHKNATKRKNKKVKNRTKRKKMRMKSKTKNKTKRFKK
jgi:hypothetical protein